MPEQSEQTQPTSSGNTIAQGLGVAGFQEFELYARLLVINRQAQIQNTAHPPKNQLTLVNESGTDALV